jgi:hypothetical protein
MLTTNQVPLITMMSAEDYEESSIYCTKYYTTQIEINHLISKVLRISKIKR